MAERQACHAGDAVTSRATPLPACTLSVVSGFSASPDLFMARHSPCRARTGAQAEPRLKEMARMEEGLQPSARARALGLDTWAGPATSHCVCVDQQRLMQLRPR